MYLVQNIFNKSAIRAISDKPGVYRWFAEITDFEKLSYRLGINPPYTEIEKIEFEGKVLYAIYVGIAVNETLSSRLEWHILQRHTPSAIKHGTLSTLRQSISSVLFGDQSDEAGTDDFIKTLYVEIYHESKHPVKSPQAKAEITKIEKDLLAKNLYILNIRENKYPGAPKKLLRVMRKAAK